MVGIRGISCADAGLLTLLRAFGTCTIQSVIAAHHGRFRRHQETSFQLLPVPLPFSSPLSAFSPRRSYASALRFRPARRPSRQALSESLSFARSDMSTRAGIFSICFFSRLQMRFYSTCSPRSISDSIIAIRYSRRSLTSDISRPDCLSASFSGICAAVFCQPDVQGRQCY